MKARVIETNEIVELQEDMNSSYFTKDGLHYKGFELDFDFEKPDYWDKLLHQYAGMAMQGVLSNEKYVENFIKNSIEGVSLADDVTRCAYDYATALINKLKEESQCEK